MYSLDIYFKTEPELSVIAQQFAVDEALFLSEVGEAWSLLMNADMFDGPLGNLCFQTSDTTTTSTSTTAQTTTSSNSNALYLSTFYICLICLVAKIF